MRDPVPAIAKYFLDTLTASPGREFHWLELAAGAEAALARKGVRLSIDSQMFSRCMRMAKVLGLPEGENAFPIYDRRGFWRVRPTVLIELKAIERAFLTTESRVKLLLTQAESEELRDPQRERYMATAELKLLRRTTTQALESVRDLIAQQD